MFKLQRYLFLSINVSPMLKKQFFFLLHTPEGKKIMRVNCNPFSDYSVLDTICVVLISYTRIVINIGEKVVSLY